MATFVARGARHVQLTNMTPLAAPELAAVKRGPAGRHRGGPAGGGPGGGVTRRALSAALSLAAAAAALVAAPAASGATRTLTLDGWYDRALAFSGRDLVWTEAATVHVDPRRIKGSPPGAQRFDYYRADVSRVRLDRASRRFAGAARDAGLGAHQHRALQLRHADADRRRRLRGGARLAPRRPSHDLVLRRRGDRVGHRQRRPRRRPPQRGRGLDGQRRALRPARRERAPGAARRRPGRRAGPRARWPPSRARSTSSPSPAATCAPGPTRPARTGCW